MQPPTLSRSTRLLLALGAGGLALALYAANGWLGNLNQDEGWYLYAALEHAAGRLPYVDFFFTQGPLMPAIYGLLAPFWEAQGVAGGRTLTAVLGFIGALVAARLAARAVPRERRFAAGLTVFLLTAGNVYHSYFTTIPKTYALSGLLLTMGLLLLTTVGRPRATWRAAPAGLLVAAAAATRLSLGAALPVVGVYLLVTARRTRNAWFWFGLGGALGLGLLFVPILLAAPEAFLFAQIFHATRAGRSLLLVGGSVARLARGYLPLLAVLVSAGALRFARPAPPDDAPRPPPAGPLLWTAVFAAVFVVHLLSPFPYDDYQVPVMPLVAAAVSAGLWRILPAAPRTQAAVLSALLLWSVTAVVASPLIQDWFVIRQDRFWVTCKTEPDLARLRAAGRWLRARVPPGSRLLTQDIYLAVEAGRRVPAGFEMGPFGFFPKVDDDRAARCRVLNPARLERVLDAAEAPVAAFSGYGLAIAAPEMAPLSREERQVWFERLDRRYRPVETWSDFGQGHTPLTFWVRR